MNTTMRATLCAGLTAGAFAMMGLLSQEAVACDPAPETIAAMLPGADEVVAPDAQIVLFSRGYEVQPLIELRDAAGELVPSEVDVIDQPALFRFIREISPQEALEEGRYTLRVTYESEWPEDFESSFEVDADHVWPELEGAPALTWYRETYAQEAGDSCQYGDEYHVLSFGEVEGAAAYRLEFDRDEGMVQQLYLSSSVGQEEGLLIEGVSCVRVAAIRGDGTTGEFTELCEPTKCNHIDSSMTPGFGSSDWDSIEGCGGEEPVEGDPDESDVGGGSDVGPDAGGWDVDEPDEQQEGAEFGCSSTGDSPGEALTVLFAMLGALVWRRR